jgi:transcriptional regulator with XRE-family HTH domain
LLFGSIVNKINEILLKSKKKLIFKNYYVYNMNMYGEKIKRIRKEANLSQEELSDRTDYAQTSISSWEKQAYPPLDFIDKVLKILKPEMKLWEFFIEDKERENFYNIPEIYLKIAREMDRFPDNIKDLFFENCLQQLRLIHASLESQMKDR